MEIQNIQNLKKEILINFKKEKFDKMVTIQNNKVIEQIKEGKSSVIWIFSDKEYYHNQMEKSWFEEFNDKAKKLFENNGYKINGILLLW